MYIAINIHTDIDVDWQ